MKKQLSLIFNSIPRNKIGALEEVRWFYRSTSENNLLGFIKMVDSVMKIETYEVNSNGVSFVISQILSAESIEKTYNKLRLLGEAYEMEFNGFEIEL